MASPQTENGYIQIANEVLEHLAATKLDGTEFRCIFFILRKTWGWKKKEDKISYGQIAEGLGISRRRAIRTVNRLVSHKTLLISKGYVNTLQFNKNYDEWLVSPKTPPSVTKDTTLVSPKTPELVSSVTPTKENKETITKEIIPNGIRGFGNPDINEVSSYFLENMKLPKEDSPPGKSRQYWHSLLKEGGRGVKGVKDLIDMASRDEWYKNNITSSVDLYYKRVKLIARLRGNQPKVLFLKKKGEL